MLLRNINIFLTMIVVLFIEWALCLFDVDALIWIFAALATAEGLRSIRAFLIQKNQARPSHPALKFFVIEMLPFHVCLVLLLMTRTAVVIPSMQGQVLPEPIWRISIEAVFVSLPPFLLLVSAWFFHWFWTKPERKNKEYFYLIGLLGIMSCGVFLLGRDSFLAMLFSADWMFNVAWLSIVINFCLLYRMMAHYKESPPNVKSTLKTAAWRAGIICILVVAGIAGTIRYPWILPSRYIAVPGVQGSGNILIIEVWEFSDSGSYVDTGISGFPYKIANKYHPIWRGRTWIYNVKNDSLIPRKWHLDYSAAGDNSPVFHERAGLLFYMKVERIIKSYRPLKLEENKYFKVFDTQGRLVDEQAYDMSGPRVFSYGDGPEFLVIDFEPSEDAGYVWNIETKTKRKLGQLHRYHLTSCVMWHCPSVANKFFFSGFPYSDMSEKGIYQLDVNTGAVRQVLPVSGPFGVSQDTGMLIASISQKQSQEILFEEYGDVADKAIIISPETGELISAFNSDAMQFRFHPSGDLIASFAYRNRHQGGALVIQDIHGDRQKEIVLSSQILKGSFPSFIPMLHWVDDNHILARADFGDGILVNSDTGEITTPRDIVMRHIRK